MAWITQGITSYIGGYVDQVVGGALKAGGGFAGDAVGAVGNGINSFGGGIEKSIRRYGDGAKDYGNAIKDWTDADGPRNTTAANPLGLPNSITGGKRSLGWSKSSPTVNSSPVYRAPSSVGTKAAIKPSPSVRRVPAQISKVTNVPVKRAGPSKVPIAGVTVKNQSPAKTKPPSGGVKKVPMAGPTMKKNQALAKKK